MPIVPDSRKTYDPEYKKAKETLKSYMFSIKKLLQSIHNLGQRALAISKFYSKFSTTVSSWCPDSPPAVQQSLNSICKSADQLNKITVDDFINTVEPSFIDAMKQHKKQTSELVHLEKKRRTAVRKYDQEKERLRNAQCAKEPDDSKIEHIQRQVNAAEETYNNLNDQYISAVSDFSERRKDEFLHSLKKCFLNLTNYINNVVSIQFISFPSDPNSPVIVDPKSLGNHDDFAQHNNTSTILPPSNMNGGSGGATYYIQDPNGNQSFLCSSSQNVQPSSQMNIQQPQQMNGQQQNGTQQPQQMNGQQQNGTQQPQQMNGQQQIGTQQPQQINGQQQIGIQPPLAPPPGTNQIDVTQRNVTMNDSKYSGSTSTSTAYPYALEPQAIYPNPNERAVNSDADDNTASDESSKNDNKEEEKSNDDDDGTSDTSKSDPNESPSNDDSDCESVDDANNKKEQNDNNDKNKLETSSSETYSDIFNKKKIKNPDTSSTESSDVESYVESESSDTESDTNTENGTKN